ncbi:MAG TPA: CU044_5270 family protein [Baekduia sp.]|jgi:hypothetical protein
MTDELQILRGWAPPEAGPDEGAAADRARARLAQHMTAAPRRAHPRWWLLAAPPALIAAAAVAVALVLSLGSGVQEGRIAPAPATAAQALEQAARSAERQPVGEVFPRPGQFFYTSTRATYLNCLIRAGGGACALSTQHRQAWVSATRRGQSRTTVLGHRWPSPRERQKWVRLGSPRLATMPAGTFALAPDHGAYLGNERLSSTQLRRFDQTGPALYRRLRDGVKHGQGTSRSGEVFTEIGDALREQPAPPKLRAALYRALKLVPGVRYLGRVRDPLGRPALAVARTEGGTRRELLFDPATAAMLAEREVVVGPDARRGFDAPEGTVIADAVYEQRGVVDRIGQTP